MTTQPRLIEPIAYDQISAKAARTLFATQHFLCFGSFPTGYDYKGYALEDLGLGPILRQPGDKESTLVKPSSEFESRSDSRTSGAIPPHSDGPWLDTPVGALMLVCHNPGDAPVPTILHDMRRFITEALPLPLLNKALTTPVRWKSDFSDEVREAPVFEIGPHGFIARWSQNQMVLGESSPDLAKSANPFVHAQCNDFIYCLAALYREWSAKPENQIHVYLKKGEMVVFNNHIFTHEVAAGKSASRCLERFFLSGL